MSLLYGSCAFGGCADKLKTAFVGATESYILNLLDPAAIADSFASGTSTQQ